MGKRTVILGGRGRVTTITGKKMQLKWYIRIQPSRALKIGIQTYRKAVKRSIMRMASILMCHASAFWNTLTRQYKKAAYPIVSIKRRAPATRSLRTSHKNHSSRAANITAPMIEQYTIYKFLSVQSNSNPLKTTKRAIYLRDGPWVRQTRNAICVHHVEKKLILTAWIFVTSKLTSECRMLQRKERKKTQLNERLELSRSFFFLKKYYRRIFFRSGIYSGTNALLKGWARPVFWCLGPVRCPGNPQLVTWLSSGIPLSRNGNEPRSWTIVWVFD